ncbi:MAG TPA: glutathione-disulfide reductase [Devosia sp.]|nr:glutathione-disulfide reductase [Devosia sp.]
MLIIGGGSAGVRAGRLSAAMGKKIAVIEADRMGGTCVIRGCIPKKLFAYAAHFSEFHDISQSYGWTVSASFDWPTLVANKNREIERLEKAYEAAVRNPGGEIIRERAVLTGPHSVRLEPSGRELTAETILLATGGHPFVPELPGKELGITSREAFDLLQLPRSMLIDGGGYVAAEFASIFAGLGVETTIVYRGNKVLRGFDEDLRDALDAGLRTRGIKLIYETTIRALEWTANGIVAHFSDGVDAPFGAVMFATGRKANTAGLGLESAGVRLDEDGFIDVDDYSRTNVPNIFAVGDVTGRVQLTPVAIRDAVAFVQTAFKDNPTAVDHSLVGTAVFSEPEIATIGLTEAEARTHGDIDVYVAKFRPLMITLTDRLERMMMKLITAPDGGKVLGVHIAGPGAAELIQMAAIPLGMGATKADFDRAVAMHPTAGEELVTFASPTYRFRGGTKV